MCDKWDFAWSSTRAGFYITYDGDEVPDTFIKAVSTFDRYGAQIAVEQKLKVMKIDTPTHNIPITKGES